MMASDQIVEANEMNFDYEVVTYSKNIPVLVDFWAEWCHPCKALGPLLEKLVQEAGGNLRLAKVNIDQNPNLGMQYNVRSIPTVKAFVKGQVVSEFVGALPEPRIREFISKLSPPSPVELDVEKGQNLLLSQDWLEAEAVLRKALEQKADSSSAHLGLAKALLAQNKPAEALDHLDAEPSGRELAKVEILKPYVEVLLRLRDDDLPAESNLDAIFRNSIKLASQGKFSIALDGLLDILRQDKHYQGKLAQNCILAILEIMGSEDPETREYRSELASALF